MTRWYENYKSIRTFPRAFWVVIAATLCNQLGNMAIVFLMLYLTQHLHYGLTKASVAFGALSLTTLLAGIFGGTLIDYVGSSKMMILTLFLNGIFLIALPEFHSFTFVIIISLLWGASYGLFRPASQAFVSLLSPPNQYKLTFSVYRLALNLGMSVGPLIGGYLATHSYHAVFIVNGFANILAGIVLYVGLKIFWHAKAEPLTRKLELSLKFLKDDKLLRLFVLGMIPISIVFFQHESTLAIFLTQYIHFPISLYGWLFTINTLMIVFLELPLNIATLNWPYRVNFIIGAFFITLGFAGMLLVTKQWHVMLLAVSWTIGEMMFYPSASSYVAEIAPIEHRGSYMSFYSTCSNIGMMFGPIIGAMSLEYAGARGLWLMCAVAGVISMIVFLQLKISNTSPHREVTK